MARRVISVIGGPPQALRAREPTLEANAYAVAEDVDLQLVLRNGGVELAVAATEEPEPQLAGAPGQDLRALIESGIGVHVETDSLSARGLTADELVDGVVLASADDVTELLRTAEAVLTW